MTFKIKSVDVKQEYYSQRKGEPYRDSNKAYVWVSGESIAENLTERRSRPYKYYQENILPEILRQVDAKHPEYKISINVKDWGWRQKCGCSMCPCSPGFIQKTGSGTVTISAEVEFFKETV
jgi:hypothetical protein